MPVTGKKSAAADLEFSCGQLLPVGAVLVHGPALKIGRFLIRAVCIDPGVDLSADHSTKGDLKAVVSTHSIFSKFYSLRPEAQTKKPKKTRMKTGKPKQRRAAGVSAPSMSSQAKQRAISDYMEKLDGPMGTESLVDALL